MKKNKTTQPVKEAGAAAINISLYKEKITVRHSHEKGQILFTKKAVKGDWDSIWNAIKNKQGTEVKVFPNGFSAWHETHFEIVSAINSQLSISEDNMSNRVKYAQGTGGLYELAEELTNKFEKMHQGREWDGDFFDEVEGFIKEELK